MNSGVGQRARRLRPHSTGLCAPQRLVQTLFYYFGGHLTAVPLTLQPVGPVQQYCCPQNFIRGPELFQSPALIHSLQSSQGGYHHSHFIEETVEVPGWRAVCTSSQSWSAVELGLEGWAPHCPIHLDRLFLGPHADRASATGAKWWPRFLLLLCRTGLCGILHRCHEPSGKGLCARTP